MTLPANSVPLRDLRRNGMLAIPPPQVRTVDATPVFSFGRCRLVVRERLLLKDGTAVSVGSRAFDLLLALVERAGETLNSQELFERVWPDVIVAKVNLRVHVAGLRKVLEDGQDGNRFIISVAGRGYRFVAPVNRVEPAVPGQNLSGREAVAAMLSSQLSRKRVISLGGPGGWGQTRVAFAIAHTLATDFDNAVCFIDLANVEDCADVAPAVAAAIGCEITPQRALSCVLDFLRARKTLLAISNCEHVFAGVAQLTERLFTEAPLVQILISSREALPPPI